MINETIKDGFEYTGASLFERCIHLIGQYPKLSSYSYVGNEVNSICNMIKKDFGQDGLEQFNKQLLLRLISESSQKIEKSGMPEDIVKLFKQNFNRIRQEIHTEQYMRPYMYTNDKFRKDIAVCSMRLIPVGALKVNMCKLPRYFLIRGGIKQFFEGAAFFVFGLQGRKPMIQVHADTKDPDLLKEFNEEGVKRTYLRIAELTKRNRFVKGVFGTTWLLDPVMDNISPWLSHWRKIVVDNGGKNFHIGHEESAVENATMKSKKRRKLYEEGKYCPKNYMFIWPRQKILKWSDSIKNR